MNHPRIARWRAAGVEIGLRLAAAKLEERAKKNPVEARILRAAAKELVTK